MLTRQDQVLENLFGSAFKASLESLGRSSGRAPSMRISRKLDGYRKKACALLKHTYSCVREENETQKITITRIDRETALNFDLFLLWVT